MARQHAGRSEVAVAMPACCGRTTTSSASTSTPATTTTWSRSRCGSASRRLRASPTTASVRGPPAADWSYRGAYADERHAARAAIRGRRSSTTCTCAGCSTTCGPRWRGSPAGRRRPRRLLRQPPVRRPVPAGRAHRRARHRRPLRRRRRRHDRVPAVRGRQLSTSSRASRRSTTSRIPRTASRELRRVVRPGGRVLVSVPARLGVRPEDPRAPLHAGSLRQLFDGWDDVASSRTAVAPSPGRCVTGTLLQRLRGGARPPPAAPAVRAAFALAYIGLNARRRGARRGRAAPPASAPRARAEHPAHRPAAGRWLSATRVRRHPDARPRRASSSARCA